MRREYKCIAMDPPWNEKGGGKSKRGADRHYPTMNLQDIAKTILGAPCWNPADDCHLWMWYTDNHLPEALSLVDMLGFRYIRTMQWVKAELLQQLSLENTTEGKEFGGKVDVRHHEFFALQSFGLGQYLRGQHEGCLLAVRGKGLSLVQNRDVGSVVMAPKGRHSAKPQAAYDAIGRVSPYPRLEMFAREHRDGWTTWGNEVKT